MAKGVHTPEQALARYRIEPTEGKVYNSIGQEVGNEGSDGYYRLTLYGEGKKWTIRRCRVIFWKHYGRWPELELDHEDRNKHNDKISNLKETSHSDQMINRRLSDNRELPVGVYLRTRMRNKPYAAVFKGKHLGLFASPEEAHQAYLTAKGS